MGGSSPQCAPCMTSFSLHLGHYLTVPITSHYLLFPFWPCCLWVIITVWCLCHEEVLLVKSVHSAAILAMLPGNYFQSYKTRLPSTWMVIHPYTRNRRTIWNGIEMSIKIWQNWVNNEWSLVQIKQGGGHNWFVCFIYCSCTILHYYSGMHPICAQVSV